MIITRLKLTNWRNFTDVDVPLLDRAFIIGPNASGKSNLLDAIRFLRDVAKREGGGLQSAVARRGGVRQIRSLSAHAGGGVGIEVHLSRNPDESVEWKYRLSFNVEHYREIIAPSSMRKWLNITAKYSCSAPIRTIRTIQNFVQRPLWSKLTPTASFGRWLSSSTK